MGIAALKNLVNLDVNAVMATTLKANEDKVREVSQDQLLRGETPSGAKLPPYANRNYVRSKIGTPKTAPGGAMNLRNSGEFHRRITPVVAGTAITWPAERQGRKYPFLVKYSNTGTLLAWNERSIKTAKETFLVKDIALAVKKQIFG